MHKVNLFQATLVALCCTICASSSQNSLKKITTNSPNHDLTKQESKNEWTGMLDTMMQKVTEMPSYQTESSKQERNSAHSYPTDQRQEAFDEKVPKNDIERIPKQNNDQEPVLIKRVLTKLMPSAYNQDDSENGKASHEDPQYMFGQRNPANRISDDNRLDHFQTTYTFEKSMSDLIKPMLHDPSESHVLKTSAKNPALLERILVSHHATDAGIDEQEPIHKRRSMNIRQQEHSVFQQEQQTNLPQALPWTQAAPPQKLEDRVPSNALAYSQSPYNMGKHLAQSEPNPYAPEPRYGQRLRLPKEDPQSLKYERNMNYQGERKIDSVGFNYNKAQGQIALNSPYQDDIHQGLSPDEYRRELMREKMLKQMKEQIWKRQELIDNNLHPRQLSNSETDPSQEREQEQYGKINNHGDQVGISQGEVVECVHKIKQQRLQEMKDQELKRQQMQDSRQKQIEEGNHRQWLQIQQYVDRRALPTPDQMVRDRQNGQPYGILSQLANTRGINNNQWSSQGWYVSQQQPQPQYQRQQRAEPLPQPHAQVQYQNQEMRSQSPIGARDRDAGIFQRMQSHHSSPQHKSFLIDSQQSVPSDNRRWASSGRAFNQLEKRSSQDQASNESPVDISVSI